MDSMTTSFGQVLLWSFWFFIWIAALMVWFRCLFDLFRDHSLGGWAKAGWVILLVLVPWLGALIYIIARGRSMNERQMNEFAQARAEQERYIKDVAGTTTTSSPAKDIASAKSLLDAGTITQSEFDALKAKALA
jgi:Phospholipase_D-nuclease N-terminal